MIAPHIEYRKNAVARLTSQIGVYVLCDLDNVPIYVGQSTDGIRARVQRHLTSARSDVIANRQIDVWEVAYVWAFPVAEKVLLNNLESTLFHHHDPQSQLMNGKLLPRPVTRIDLPDPDIIQVIQDSEIEERKDPQLRLVRQAKHYADIIGHFLTVKNSPEIARAMGAHFARLTRYHQSLLDLSENPSQPGFL